MLTLAVDDGVGTSPEPEDQCPGPVRSDVLRLPERDPDPAVIDRDSSRSALPGFSLPCPFRTRSRRAPGPAESRG